MRFQPFAPRNVLAVPLLIAGAPTVEGAQDPRRLIGIAP